MEELEKKTKVRITKKKTILKDGTVKEYTSVNNYAIKGYVNPDGSVSKLSPAQKDDIKGRYKLGVSVARLAKDFGVSRPTIMKILGE